MFLMLLLVVVNTAVGDNAMDKLTKIENKIKALHKEKGYDDFYHPPSSDGLQRLYEEHKARVGPSEFEKRLAASSPPRYIVGLTTVKRDGENYLKETLLSFIDEDVIEKVYVFLADHDKEKRNLMKMEVASIGNQKIHLIDKQNENEQWYPSFIDDEKSKERCWLPRNFGDSLERTLWRSHIVLDHSYLLWYVYQQEKERNVYYIHIEDDVQFIGNLPFQLKETKILYHSKSEPYHEIKGARFGGAFGLIMHVSVLSDLSVYLRSHFANAPVDWLMGDFFGKDNQRLLYPASWLHKGKSSSKENFLSKQRQEGLYRYWEDCS